jgi:KUP system potassium uptake protein
MITPAISVLSAVEGLHLATPAFDRYVIPIALMILVGLFLIQRHGTARVGSLFGPVMLVWFAVLAILGVHGILMNPQVLAALNPMYGVMFFVENGLAGFIIFGAVVLAVTGTEGLYADMGHFGRRPLRLVWFGYVLPALVLNYFGQGALLLARPEAVANPFYLLAPSWALYPMVGLSTVATVIASQAMITGAFSITRQAIQLGYAPRMNVMHTSEREIGQIFVPFINWTLLVGIVVLVIGFKTSSNLAAAYGIAVTATMTIDSVLVFFIARGLWGWRWPVAFAVSGGFFLVDMVLFSANVQKVLHGGWFPIAMAMVIFVLLSTWKRGRALLADRLTELAIAIEPFLDSVARHPPARVAGTAVFLTTKFEGVPHALMHNLKHNKVLHERVVLLTVIFQDIPHIDESERIEIWPLGNDFYKLFVIYGFKDETNVTSALELCAAQGLEFNMMDTSFFLSRETLIPSAKPGMALWREKLFISMARNAGSVTTYFQIPTNRVVELGTQVEL